MLLFVYAYFEFDLINFQHCTVSLELFNFCVFCILELFYKFLVKDLVSITAALVIFTGILLVVAIVEMHVLFFGNCFEGPMYIFLGSAY